jgi:phage/plasmid-like protein (TIGR03299 family)
MSQAIIEFAPSRRLITAPWAGIGVEVPAGADAATLQRAAGLDWRIEKVETYVKNAAGDYEVIEGTFATTRSDNGRLMGVVGARYEPCQNEDFFKFVEAFARASRSRVETCGSLRWGRTVWAMAKAGTVEYVPGDPVGKHLLIRNTHDAKSRIEILFTDVRAVCLNTLSADMRGAPNKDGVPHTRNLKLLLGGVGAAVLAHDNHSRRLTETMRFLAGVRKDSTGLEEMTRALIGVPTYSRNPAEGPGGRARAKIAELIESGAGASIPGVRGTAYGWLNAVTEYVDHHRPVRAGGRDAKEARFESALEGAGARLKQDAFDLALMMSK